MSSGELERGVLGALIFAPGLLQACKLRDTDFREGQFRTTFRAIAETWKLDRPKEIDPVLLAEKVGGNGAGEFIASLMDGMIRLEEPAFRGRVAELRKRA